MLVDKKVFGRRKESDIMLEKRANDLESEGLREAWIQKRVRTLKKAWTKLPIQ